MTNAATLPALVLLPGLDGTGKLFSEFVKELRSSVDSVIGWPAPVAANPPRRMRSHRAEVHAIRLIPRHRVPTDACRAAGSGEPAGNCILRCQQALLTRPRGHGHYSALRASPLRGRPFGRSTRPDGRVSP